MEAIDVVTDYATYLVVTIFVFLPSIFAFKNKHHQRWLILIVNFLLNGIGIGWIVAWVLYFSIKPESENAPEAQVETLISPEINPSRSNL